MIIISLFTYFSYRQLSDEYIMLTRTENVHKDLDDIVYRLEETRTLIHGYLMTGDTFYLESMEHSSKNVEDRLVSLDSILKNDLKILEVYDSLKTATRLQLSHIDSLANHLLTNGKLDQEDIRLLQGAEERLEEIRGLQKRIGGILRPPGRDGFLTSRTATPLFIIIGFMVAIGAIIYLYTNLYRSLQSNLAAETQLEKNLIELGHEIQERVEAENLVERILDSADGAILLFRPIYKNGEVDDFRIEKCNHQAEVISGLAKSDLIGKKLLEIFPGSRESGLFDAYIETLHTGKEFRTQMLYDYDELHIYLEIRAIPLDDGLVVTATDVSSRIRTQRAIEENNRKFSMLFHQAFQFIALINEMDEIIDINKSFLQFLNATSNEIAGRDLADLSVWRGDLSATIRQMLKKAKEQGSSREEALVTGHDGDEVYLDLSCTLIPGDREDLIIFEARDLTELHWAQEENEFLAHLNVSITHAEDFNHAAKLVFSKIGKRYELDSTEVWVPLGDTQMRLLSQYLFDPGRDNGREQEPFVIPRDVGVINEVMKNKQMVYIPSLHEVGSAEVFRRQLLIERGYKSLFAVPIVFEGEVLLVAMFLADEEIAEIEELKKTLQIMSSSLGALLIKKRVQDEVQRTNLVLNEAEKLSRLGSWEWYLSDGRLRWSEGMYRIMNLSKDYEPDFEEYFDFVHEEDREMVRRTIKENVSSRLSYEMEFRLILRDGEFKYVKSTGHPVYNEFGEVYAHTGTLQDITAQKKHEMELEDKNRELEDSNKNLEQFAYIASHDLQEPLRKIRAFGGRLADKYESQLDGKGTDYLNRMQNAAERMQTLINDLLKYSRVARNQAPLQETELNDVIRGVIDDLETTIRESDASVFVDELPVVSGDPLQLRQLFQNLLTNALKFVPSERTPEIKIWAEYPDQNGTDKQENEFVRQVSVKIRDNGIGVDERYKERIFGLFERLHGRSEYSGTGIGLAICKRVVQNHNGEIRVESEKGKGTTFEIIFPIKQTELTTYGD